MAGDWIKMRVELRKDPAVKTMARALGISRFEVIGRLHAVWSWADQQLRDGNAPGVTLADLDEEAELPGFAKAMADAQWLKILSTGIVFVNFDEHNGKPAKERALTNKRVKRHRNADTVTEPLPEKRRVFINTTTVANSTAAPQPPPKPEEKSTSKPRAPSTKLSKTNQLLQEQRQAAQLAVPMPDHLKPKQSRQEEPFRDHETEPQTEPQQYHDPEF
jgi:hypothetical protein